MKDKRKQQVCHRNNGGISAFVCDSSFTLTCFICHLDLFLIALIESIFSSNFLFIPFFITSRVNEENAGENPQSELL